MRPKALGLAVVHDQGGPIESTRRAKVEHSSVDDAIESYSGVRRQARSLHGSRFIRPTLQLTDNGVWILFRPGRARRFGIRGTTARSHDQGQRDNQHNILAFLTKS